MAVPSATVDLSAALVAAPVPLAQWLAVAPLALCIAAGAVLMLLSRAPRLQAGVAITALALLVAVNAGLLWTVANDGPLTMMLGRWLPPFGIALTADLTGALFSFTAAVVALAGGVYALKDIGAQDRRNGFFPLLLFLMAGVSGAFLTGDIFNLYVWFEVLLISSFGLLVLGATPRRIDGALKYAVLNLIGTTLFLIAVGLLYAVFGTLNMADIAVKAGRLRDSAPLMTLAALFLTAFAMKAAAFPVNFWLPASYHTPNIAVSALFGGLLTKVGVYAALRVMVMLFAVEREALSLAIAVAAALTMVLGALGALAQDDLRRLTGYAVITGIGSMLAGLAIGGTAGLSGAIFYALNSMVLMTALYFAAGEAARLGGSFSLTGLGGLHAAAPAFSALSLALFLGMSGLPPFSGFWPKVVLVKAALDIGAWWLAGAMLLSGFVTTLAYARVFLLAYWRPRPSGLVPAAGLSWQAALPLAVLTALTVFFGLFPERLMAFSQIAATGLQDPQAYLRSVFPAGGGP